MSSGEELAHFQALIDAVEKAYYEANPGLPTPIREWRGGEIGDFQEALLLEVKGRISEKWFYTHIRQRQKRLPRIDMLNLLSRYAGWKDWSDFCYSQITSSPETSADIVRSPEMDAEKVDSRSLPETTRSFKKWLPVGVLVILTLVAVSVLLATNRDREYKFCFVDQDTGGSVGEGGQVTLFPKGESPMVRSLDPEGCFAISTSESSIRIKVEIPYYHPMEIVRELDKSASEEVVPVKTDDYALMLHFFSTSKVDDWKRRRSQLDEMFLESARIVQVSGPDGMGMEMFNKDEFINKMTLPVSSLRNIHILDLKYEGEKIQLLRFMQK